MADITISLGKYNQLIQRSEWLAYLEAAGVDNWEGTGSARQAYREDHPEDTGEEPVKTNLEEPERQLAAVDSEAPAA